MIVCLCNRLNEADVHSAAEAGARDGDDVHAHHGVAAQCQCCLELMDRMVGEVWTRACSAAE
ncbi:MAG: (2Fe-2S)-binding protein [Caulobacterales bacterium]|nr:(2Fe-2S)-binding protein [Caulobacterales bacterium]